MFKFPRVIQKWDGEVQLIKEHWNIFQVHMYIDEKQWELNCCYHGDFLQQKTIFLSQYHVQQWRAINILQKVAYVCIKFWKKSEWLKSWNEESKNWHID